jgi:hypothetical protein
MQFTNMLILHNILRPDEAWFALQCVLNVNKSPLGAANSHAIFECRYHRQRLGWNRRDIVVGPCLLPDRSSARRCLISGNRSTGAA